jgi:multicomponent Na+:H+ antiporter subunit E
MAGLLTALPLFLFWLVLTGSVRPLDLALGALFSAMVGAWAARFLWAGDPPHLTIRTAGALIGYVVHLLKSVVVAAVHVAEVVVDPRMPVDPLVIEYRTALSTDTARTAFANSVTMTPGTLTVEIEGETLLIHCLAERFADEITSGELERRVARVFEEA